MERVEEIKPSKDEIADAKKEWNVPHPEYLPLPYKGESKIKPNVLELLLKHERGEATEMMMQEILKKNKIYSIRHEKVQEMWIYSDGIYIPEAPTYCRQVVRKILGKAYTTSLANEVIAKIEVDTFIDPDDFFKVENVNEIAVKNGLLNLKTKKLTAFSNLKIHFNKIPVEYDEKSKCPAIDKFLSEVLPNKEDVVVIEELFGFLLKRDYFIAKAFMFQGGGRNGKSRLIELKKRFLGVRNCTNISLIRLEKDQYALSNLLHKMANLSPDIGSTGLTQTGIFNSITDRDLLSANRKYLSNIDFVNYSKQVFCCNDLPKPHNTTKENIAFWSRWILFKFLFTFLSQKEINALPEEEREFVRLADPKIIEKISTDEELSGLLNLALAGLKRLHKQGDFSYSPTTAEVNEMWIRSADSFSAFLQDECEEDPNGFVSKKDLNKAYKIYCRNHKVKIMGLRSIKATLEEKGIAEGRVSFEGSPQEYVWDGLTFIDKMLSTKRIKDMDVGEYAEGMRKLPKAPAPKI